MHTANRISRALALVYVFVGLGALATKNLVEKTARRSHLHCIATLASALLNTPMSDEVLWRNNPSNQMENIMRRRVMMILASAVLASSLLATGAQARGGGGGGGGHGGGGMGGFGGGHIGAGVGDIGGGHMGGLGADRIGGLGGDHVDGFSAGRMAHVDQGHFGIGRHHFVGGIYDDGLGCPYDPSYTPPYNCTY
jgi:hypothetical protein